MNSRLSRMCLFVFFVFAAVSAAAAETILDNGTAGTSFTGQWGVSGAPSPYGANSVWSRDGDTYTWSFTPAQTGNYQVAMWWTQWSSRSTAIPVDIQHAAGTARVTINQQLNGGQWNLLGAYTLNAGTTYKVTITSQPGPSSTCADAVMFTYSPNVNVPPTAVIDSVTPETPLVGQSVAFTGHGTDADGSVTAYEWSSSLDGSLSAAASFTTALLRAGTHTISFRVQDNSGSWSSAVTRSLTITALTTEVIVDNLSGATSKTGVWDKSSAPGFYDKDSVWSRDGSTFSWSFTPARTGNYQVAMWWTQWSSRSTAIPVDIQHAAGTARVTINQQLNGGQWNLLGAYTLNAGTTYKVTITSQPGPSSTCADAVMFTYSPNVNVPPVATIDSVTPETPLVGQSVAFTGHGTDADGSVTAYEWSSNLDGSLSAAASFTTALLRAGTHTISFRVQDNSGSWSSAVTRSLTITALTTEVIVDNLSGATSKTGVWDKSSAPGFYDKDSVWSRDGSTFSWSFTPARTGNYQVAMWWTQWSSRSTAIPVDIQHAAGLARVTINQQLNGGQWNLLGVYTLTAGLTYKVTVTSQPGPTSTCADAVRFTYSPNVNVPPVATIDSVTPNPAVAGSTVTLSGHGTDTDGTIAGYTWRSDLDGILGNAASVSSNTLTSGTHGIYFKVADDKGAWSPEVSTPLVVNEQIVDTEHIYIIVIYNTRVADFIEMLQSVGAVQSGALWKYTNRKQKKEYLIHLVQDMAGALQALYTEDAHIIMGGHSNYGMGGIFATAEETATNVIESIRFIDDPRIFTYSSPWFYASVAGMIGGQSYPNWRPVFQDGTGGIMPYDFGGPDGDPAYNYYPTYQVPGDPTRYKVETVRNSASERFPGSNAVPWYSPSGVLPDPAAADDRKYYIVNSDNSFVSDAPWLSAADVAGYYGSSYCWVTAGPGAGQSRWNFEVPAAGVYGVYAWWPASAAMVPDAVYTVTDATGSHTISIDQRNNGGQWNLLGEFSFAEGPSAVFLGSGAATGTLAADAIRVTRLDDPTVYDRIIDNLRCPKPHFGGSTILFRNDLDLDISRLAYKRLLFDACSVGIYYLDTFHRGLMFYTATGSNGSGTYPYLKNYLEGKSDYEIWSAMQAVQPVYDYYDFSKRPSEQ